MESSYFAGGDERVPANLESLAKKRTPSPVWRRGKRMLTTLFKDPKKLGRDTVAMGRDTVAIADANMRAIVPVVKNMEVAVKQMFEPEEETGPDGPVRKFDENEEKEIIQITNGLWLFLWPMTLFLLFAGWALVTLPSVGLDICKFGQKITEDMKPYSETLGMPSEYFGGIRAADVATHCMANGRHLEEALGIERALDVGGWQLGVEGENLLMDPSRLDAAVDGAENGLHGKNFVHFDNTLPAQIMSTSLDTEIGLDVGTDGGVPGLKKFEYEMGKLLNDWSWRLSSLPETAAPEWWTWEHVEKEGQCWRCRVIDPRIINGEEIQGLYPGKEQLAVQLFQLARKKESVLAEPFLDVERGPTVTEYISNELQALRDQYLVFMLEFNSVTPAFFQEARHQSAQLSASKMLRSSFNCAELSNVGGPLYSKCLATCGAVFSLGLLIFFHGIFALGASSYAYDLWRRARHDLDLKLAQARVEAKIAEIERKRKAAQEDGVLDCY